MNKKWKDLKKGDIVWYILNNNNSNHKLEEGIITDIKPHSIFDDGSMECMIENRIFHKNFTFGLFTKNYNIDSPIFVYFYECDKDGKEFNFSQKALISVDKQKLVNKYVELANKNIDELDDTIRRANESKEKIEENIKNILSF